MAESLKFSDIFEAGESRKGSLPFGGVSTHFEWAQAPLPSVAVQGKGACLQGAGRAWPTLDSQDLDSMPCAKARVTRQVPLLVPLVSSGAHPG